ncbi:methyltransferase domain-containing protein [Streptomyces longispororuber]|uniref:class I SAM-dependent methyltransferase n=1 Tax=Streptomyces longispororuber TaxID=68230 RepID=UPI0033EBF6D4
MTTLPRRALRALDRFNAAHPWDHNAHYHRWIMRQLPRHIGRALDVGCGSGDLARLLATRADSVTGVDADPDMVVRARERTRPGAPVTFVAADALTGLPPGPYDVITCVATLHHLPFADALACFRRHLAPGGTLVVVGLSRPQTLVDHVLGAVAVPANAAVGWFRNGGRPAPRPVSMTAATRPATMGSREVADEARRVLPGARMRRRLFWRYTLVFRRDAV